MKAITERQQELIDAALPLAARGERLVILHGIGPNGKCTCQGRTTGCNPGKHPRFEDYIRKATIDPTEIQQLFTKYPVSNFGRLVRDDELIVDVDKPKRFAELERSAGPLPRTPTVLTGTGNGRRQYSLKRPVGEIRTKYEWGEVKISGHVVVPPSATRNPYRYEAGCSFDEVERAECPPGWCELLVKPTVIGASETITVGTWTQDLGDLLLKQSLESARDTQRHPACKDLALQLRDNRAPYPEAKKIVETFADSVEDDGDHPFDRSEAQSILESIYQKRPREPWAKPLSALPPTETMPEARTISFWDLTREEPDEEPSILGEGIIVCGSVNVLAGEGGVGKTCLAVQIGLCIASKTPFVGTEVKEAVPVLYLLAEGNRYKFADRLERGADELGLQLENLPIFCLDQKQPIPQIGDPAFARLVEKVKAGVVFLDTHGYFHGGEDNSRSDWKNLVVKPLRALPSAPAVILLDHLSKENLRFRSKSKRLGPRIVGAGNKRDDSDSVFILDWPNGERDPLRVLYFDKLKNQEPKEPLDLAFDLPTGTFSLKPSSVSTTLAKEATRLEAVREVVKSKMKTGEISKRLAKRLPLGQSAIEKLIKTACQEKVIRQVKKGTYGPFTDEQAKR